jgi:hypothetical protein
MLIVFISKDSKGLLAKFPQSPLPHRLTEEHLEAFKADGDHWDDWSLDMGAEFTTAMSDENCDKWRLQLDVCI